MSFLNELKRRDVFRVAIAYLAVSWLVLQVTDTIVPILELPAWVPRLVLFLLLIGFPIALALSWAYEITPAGLKKTHEDGSRPRPAAPRQRINKLIIGSLLAVVAIMLIDRLNIGSGADKASISLPDQDANTTFAQPAVDSPRIAVLPFTNVSADSEQEYFSDGMTDELISMLTKVPGLSVAARTSTFSFKGEKVDIPTIASALQATHVLEGSVRKNGNQIRISLQLTNAADGYNLWADSYDKTLDDVFAVHREIAESVADALQLTLLGNPFDLKETTPEAYNLYLKARYFDNLKGAKNWEKAISYYQEALSIDPTYAPAWAGLSITYRYQSNVGLRELDEGMQLARGAAQKALELDEDLAVAWSNLALIEMLHRWDWDAAARAAQKAMQLEPGNADVLSHTAGVQQVLGNLDESILLLQRAIEIDPLSLSPHNALGLAYMNKGQFDEAEVAFQKLLELNPEYPWVTINIGRLQLLKGDPEAALSEFEAGTGNLWHDSGIIMALSALGRDDEANSAFAEFENRFGKSGGAFHVASIYAWRGDAEKAFEWLKRSYEKREPGLIFVPTDIFFKKLYPDPRWNDLLEELGLSQVEQRP